MKWLPPLLLVCLWSLQADAFKCPVNYEGLVGDPTNCGAYFICKSGQETLTFCHYPQKFDIHTFECTSLDSAKCAVKAYIFEDGNNIPLQTDYNLNLNVNLNGGVNDSKGGSNSVPSQNSPAPESEIKPKSNLDRDNDHDKVNDDNINGNDNDYEIEWDEENVDIKIITITLNINTVLDKLVIEPVDEPEEPETTTTTNPENPNVKVIDPVPCKKKKKKVKVNLNIENPEQVQALVNKVKGDELIQKLMESIPKSEHQTEIANIFSDVVKQAVKGIEDEKAQQGPNFSNGKMHFTVIIDEPKHVEALIQAAGEDEIEDKLRSELPENEMTILDSIWAAVRRSAAKNR